jgi:hypothetical protein
VFQHRTPTNTDGTLSRSQVEHPVSYAKRRMVREKLRHLRRRIADMADAGMGWEDIVVRLRRDGENVDAHKHTIRRFVLSKARRPLRGGSGRFAACDGAAADAER